MAHLVTVLLERELGLYCKPKFRPDSTKDNIPGASSGGRVRFAGSSITCVLISVDEILDVTMLW